MHAPGGPLPVLESLPRLRTALAREGVAVLSAPPGTGKTTAVPPALLDEPWLGEGRIVLLEPRRLAARAAASRMAFLRGEAVGGSVGYRIRGESRVGPRTRIEVVTEGILTRMLQRDPALEGVGLVVFDEFHERSLHADLGLAFTLQSREILRADLRVLVMSATLEVEGVARLLGDAPVVEAAGRSFPVEVRYRRRPWTGRLEELVARVVPEVLEEEAEGDVLVFLPGSGEIRRVEGRIRERGLPSGVAVLPLHGSLPRAAQDRVLDPAPPGVRRVVLATDIAETSLTLEGVRVVVDGGFARVPRFDPRTGMTSLRTVRVSRASAEQRRGRAGRVAEGLCLRLWTEAEQATLPLRAVPEILEADLAPLALELARWGTRDPASLRWLDPPPAGALSAARELLQALGALDREGGLTPHGAEMARTGLHPRLAHILLTARGRGAESLALACDIAALLEERDPLPEDPEAVDPSLELRLALLAEGRRGRVPGFDRMLLERVGREADRLRRRMGVEASSSGQRALSRDPSPAGILVAPGFPDRLGMATPGRRGRFTLAGGGSVSVDPRHSLADAPFVVAARVMGQERGGRLLLGAPLQEEELRAVWGTRIQRLDRVEWDEKAEAVSARWEERLGELILRSGPLQDPDPERVAAALLKGIRVRGWESIPWPPEARGLLARGAFLHAVDPEGWPDLSPEALLTGLETWLTPWIGGVRSMEALSKVDWMRVAESLLPPGGLPRLERLAPSHVEVPSGSRIRVDYADPSAPVLAVRLQELFGLPATPTVAGGRVPLTLHLLSPARRPVQVTRDLASFWRSGYAEVRRELRGRYPKHSWPEDPLAAEAVRGAPRRG